MEKKLVDRAIKSFGQTATEADLFGPPTGGKDDRVANAADIDQAMDDLIREKQLADEIDGAAPPRANADKTAFDIHGARVAIGKWAESVELSHQILNDAQKALADTPLGGAHKPWQVSLVQRGAEISFVHWHDPAAREGRMCNDDSGGKIIWPAGIGGYAKESWPEETTQIIHPAIGARARQSRILRERVAPDISRLQHMASLSSQDLATVEGVVATCPSVGMCYICGRGDHPFEGDPEENAGCFLTHLKFDVIRTCSLCCMELHFDCLMTDGMIIQAYAKSIWFPSACPRGPGPQVKIGPKQGHGKPEARGRTGPVGSSRLLVMMFVECDVWAPPCRICRRQAPRPAPRFIARCRPV